MESEKDMDETRLLFRHFDEEAGHPDLNKKFFLAELVAKQGETSQRSRTMRFVVTERQGSISAELQHDDVIKTMQDARELYAGVSVLAIVDSTVDRNNPLCDFIDSLDGLLSRYEAPQHVSDIFQALVVVAFKAGQERGIAMEGSWGNF